jgi:hypothetical protein
MKTKRYIYVSRNPYGIYLVIKDSALSLDGVELFLSFEDADRLATHIYQELMDKEVCEKGVEKFNMVKVP